MKLTEGQQLAIDLIKTGCPKNLRIAFDLNYSQKLGLESIYSGIYNKWGFLIHENEAAIIENFPILACHGRNPLKDIRRYDRKDFKNGLDGICELLNDQQSFFGLDEGKNILIVPEEDMRENNYQEMAWTQDYTSNKTGIKPERIFIGYSLDMPF
jgi:hypothetical protein